MPNYQIVIDQKVIKQIKDYHQKLIQEQNGATDQNVSSAGRYLAQQINKLKANGINLGQISTEGFIQLLINTKQPKVFAEYDNGVWSGSGINNYNPPFKGTLLFTPGALLRAPNGAEPVDLQAVTTSNGAIDDEKYYELYEQRLLPLLIYANAQSTTGNKAFITIPGVGCGEFAGKFKGQLEAKLKKTLERILEKHQKQLPNIAAVYFDPFEPNLDDKGGPKTFGTTKLITKSGNTTEGKSQLCKPEEYGKYKNCKFFSVVAWDHFSWPGNDYWIGSRHTDDGVKAAATSCMESITGIKGEYETVLGNPRYFPPKDEQGYYRDNWSDLAKEEKVKLEVSGKILVSENGQLVELKEEEGKINAETLAIVPQSFNQPQFESAIELAKNYYQKS